MKQEKDLKYQKALDELILAREASLPSAFGRYMQLPIRREQVLAELDRQKKEKK